MGEWVSVEKKSHQEEANILSWGSINRAGALSSSKAKMSLEKHLGQDMESCEPWKVYLCRYQRTVRN